MAAPVKVPTKVPLQVLKYAKALVEYAEGKRPALPEAPTGLRAEELYLALKALGMDPLEVARRARERWEARGRTGELRPFAYFEAGGFYIYLSDGLTPLLRVSGPGAKAMFEALVDVFGNPLPDGAVPIPPHLFPIVAAWSVAAIGCRDPKALLEKALRRTPKVVADAVWELAYLSSLKRRGKKGKALIDGQIARQAAKHLRGLLELWHKVAP